LPLHVLVIAQARVAMSTLSAFGAWFFRYWSIPAIAVGLVYPRCLVPVAILVTLTSLAEWGKRRPRLNVLATAALYLADLGAYQIGTWLGAISEVSDHTISVKRRIHCYPGETRAWSLPVTDKPHREVRQRDGECSSQAGLRPPVYSS
jgi:hypothetical protein